MLIFILVVILWDNMRQPRRGKLGDRQTCRGGGGARRTDTGAEAVGVRQEERATSRRRLSKGKPAIWGPSFPPLPSPQAPRPQSPCRPFRLPGPVLVAPRAAELRGLGQTAFLLLGDGVPQPVASPRLRGRGGARGDGGPVVC